MSTAPIIRELQLELMKDPKSRLANRIKRRFEDEGFKKAAKKALEDNIGGDGYRPSNTYQLKRA